jgi:two-component system, cell cycle response regulator CpdR
MSCGSLVGLGPLAVVAEDDDAARRLVAIWLESVGFCVHTAPDGVALLECLDALERARALEEPFLVVTDVDMPKVDGLAALARFGPKFPQAVVVVVTAFGDFRTRQRAHTLGAAAVLDKPFHLGELSSVVSRELRLKRQQASAPTDTKVSRQSMTRLVDRAGDQKPKTSSAGGVARRGA